MILVQSDLKNGYLGIPHVCGGDPSGSPHSQSNLTVFPTYVGVILWLGEVATLNQRIPHVCGGDPIEKQIKGIESSVFPTYVGVILIGIAYHTTSISYSPRMWG